MQHDSNLAISGKWVPEARMQFLPGCKNCGDRHPLAYKPPVDSPSCLGCGLPLPELPEPTIEYAALGGLEGLTVRVLSAIGRFLHWCARKF